MGQQDDLKMQLEAPQGSETQVRLFFSLTLCLRRVHYGGDYVGILICSLETALKVVEGRHSHLGLPCRIAATQLPNCD